MRSGVEKGAGGAMNVPGTVVGALGQAACFEKK